MIEYYPIDLPGKSLYTIPFNIEIRKVTPLEVKYAFSLFQKQQLSPDEYLDFLKKFIRFDNQEMTAEKLFWFDFKYILYQIRYKTFKNYPIKLHFTCSNEECGKEFVHELDIGALQILEPSDIQDFSTKIELDNLGRVDIRNKTVGDDAIIYEFAKSKDIDLTSIDNLVFLADLAAISNVYSLEELYKFAEEGTLTAEDILKIEDWLAKTIWGFKEEIMIKCPICGKEEPRQYILSLGDYFSVDRS